MDDIALIVGNATMTLGAVIFVSLLAWAAVECAWAAIKALVGWPLILKLLWHRVELLEYLQATKLSYAKNDLEPCKTVQPKGFWCSREDGHEGPCAARPQRR